MRGLDVILGALLLSSGLLAPGLVSPGDVLDPANVTGSATFEQANYTGQAEVEASEAALEAIGPVRATLSADDVVLTLLEKTQARYTVENDDYPGLEVRGHTGLVNESTERFENATIHLEGYDDGELQVWSNASLGPATFRLGLAPGGETTIIARSYNVNFAKDGVYSHKVQGPLFALGHDTDSRGISAVTSTAFEDLAIDGGIDFLFDNGTVTIDHNGEAQDYRASDGVTHSDPSGHIAVGENTFIALSLRGTNGTLDFEDLQSTFYAPEPRWTVNGTLSFDAEDGRLGGDAANRTLQDDTVALDGRTTLELEAQEAERPLLRERLGPARLGPFSTYDPPVDAAFEGDADNVTLNGEPVQVPANGSPPIEDITFWSRVLGLILLVASVGKKLVGFLAPLVIDNPLGNDRRREIFEFLKDAGMAHVREVHRATGIAKTSLIHHLRVLREHNLVIEVEENGFKVYFPTSTDLSPEQRQKLALLADPSRRSIAERLVQQGPHTQEALVEEVGLSRGQVSRQLSKLASASLVAETEAWPRRYEPSQLLQRWIDQLDSPG